MSGLGVDIACGDDLDPLFGLVSERDCLIQAILHRFRTQRGTLIDDLNYGLLVAAWQNDAMTPARAFALQTGIAAEALKDERVLSASASTSFDLASNKLKFALSVEDLDGPFTLTIIADALSVELLAVTSP